MVQKTSVNSSKNLSRTEAQTILFCPSSKYHVPGVVERGLRKTKGVKEVTINAITHSAKIRYDPNKVTLKELRSVLKKLHSNRRSHIVGKKRGKH